MSLNNGKVATPRTDTLLLHENNVYATRITLFLKLCGWHNFKNNVMRVA